MLDAAGFCIGCLRTMDEIAGWKDMSAGEQWLLLDRLEERRRLRPPAGPAATPPEEGSSES
jgi:predicted Fe-S protein YdhL (DUF1289 family)